MAANHAKLREHVEGQLRDDPNLTAAEAREEFAPNMEAREFALKVYNPVKRGLNPKSGTRKRRGNRGSKPDLRALVASFASDVDGAKTGVEVSEAFSKVDRHFPTPEAKQELLSAAKELHGINTNRKEVKEYLAALEKEADVLARLEKVAVF